MGKLWIEKGQNSHPQLNAPTAHLPSLLDEHLPVPLPFPFFPHTHTPLFIRRSNGKLAEHLKVRTDGCQLCCSRMVGLCSTALPAIASPFVLLLSMNFSSKEEDGSRMLFVVSLIVLTLLT